MRTTRYVIACDEGLASANFGGGFAAKSAASKRLARCVKNLPSLKIFKVVVTVTKESDGRKKGRNAAVQF